MRIEIRNSAGYQVGEYQLDPMPGCPRVGISHGLRIHEEHRGRGYGKQAMKDRLAKAKELGYDILLATVVSNNERQNAILSKNQWKRVREFTNMKTNHQVTLWMRHVSDPWEDFGGV